MKAVFDTNIIIDYLNGFQKAKKELSLYSEKFISIITWIEVLIGCNTEEETDLVKKYLKNFVVIPLENRVALLAISIKQTNKIKLPDAIIYASAKDLGCLLVTRNTNDFDKSSPDVREPYKI